MSRVKDRKWQRQQEILKFLKEEIHKTGYAPSVREIMNAVGVKSTSTIHSDLDALHQQGYIRKDPSRPRALVILEDEEEEKNTSVKEASIYDMVADREDIIDVPIIGRVAAGLPIYAETNIEDIFPIPQQYARGDCFMLRVKGDSMINVGIYDDDLILVTKQNVARNGDIVVAIIDGFVSEATVKTFYQEKDKVRLQPENDSMSPIYAKEVRIVGKVTGVFRFF